MAEHHNHGMSTFIGCTNALPFDISSQNFLLPEVFNRDRLNYYSRSPVTRSVPGELSWLSDVCISSRFGLEKRPSAWPRRGLSDCRTPVTIYSALVPFSKPYLVIILPLSVSLFRSFAPLSKHSSHETCTAPTITGRYLWWTMDRRSWTRLSFANICLDTTHSAEKQDGSVLSVYVGSTLLA